MSRSWLQSAAVVCISLWGAIWLLFIGVRFSSFDVSQHRSLGPVLLVLLLTVLVAPLAAIGFAIAAVVQRPAVLSNWITLGCAGAAFAGQALLFLITRWM
jgi:hypothetical protein